MQPHKLLPSRVGGIGSSSGTSPTRDLSTTRAATGPVNPATEPAAEPAAATNLAANRTASVAATDEMELSPAAVPISAAPATNIAEEVSVIAALTASESVATGTSITSRLVGEAKDLRFENKQRETEANTFDSTSWENIESQEKMLSDERTGPHECSGCSQPITDRYLLKAVERYWHEDCLKCSCCDCRLGEVGCTLFTKAGLLLCRRDYLRLFGESGYCCVCSKLIPAFELVMRSRDNVYHVNCFACQQCNHRFCVGDRYYVHHNTILCEYDYYKKLYACPEGNNVSMKSTYQMLPPGDITTNHLHGNPDVTDDSSSGYGSPSPTAS